jgi:hypothetical protein
LRAGGSADEFGGAFSNAAWWARASADGGDVWYSAAATVDPPAAGLHGWVLLSCEL